jgi:hypothetical protein
MTFWSRGDCIRSYGWLFATGLAAVVPRFSRETGYWALVNLSGHNSVLVGIASLSERPEGRGSALALIVVLPPIYTN